MTYTPISVLFPPSQVKQQLWGEEILLVETEHYSLKVLHYKAGHAGGLQCHTRKTESFTLHSGFALVDYDDGTGKLVTYHMTEGETIHVPAGAAHRFRAIEDCVVYEASLPVKDDRIRLERYYRQPEVEGLPSTAPEPEPPVAV